MKITEDKAFADEIIQRIAMREFQERTGVHSSDLIYCLNKQALRKLCPIPNTDKEILLFSLGWASQRWLTGTFEPDTEIEKDGIIVTPDMMIPRPSVDKKPRDGEGWPWELKCTYQSSTKPIEDSPHWIRQIMSQCYVTNSTVAHLTRLEIMGNWKWVWHPKEEKIKEYIQEFGEEWADHPTLHAYRLEFTKAELKRHWEWMNARKWEYESILDRGKLTSPFIALAPGMEWECGFCAYQGSKCKGVRG